jgi:alpha-beta hydrolase superfamily lysophospholipase
LELIRVSVMSFVLAVATAVSVTFVPAQSSSAPTVCSDVTTPISVTGVPHGTIYGRYCRTTAPNSRPLQILVPGVTYTGAYFDLPGFDGRYSYTKFMNSHGYDTLAIDRLGIGRSTRPLLAAAVTAYSNADALHQVVAAVRANGLSGRHYAKIVLTGHSYGTFTSDLTSATYRGVDGVIGTGWLQQPTVLGLTGLTARLWPAATDPRFLGTVLDPEYVTTRPGTRDFFYETADTDPAVLALDQQTKNTASLAELTYLLPATAGLSTRIGVPTLRIIGAVDKVMCNPTPCSQQALEKTAPAMFPSGVTVYVQPGAGHDVALELGNAGGFAAALSWLDKQFH